MDVATVLNLIGVLTTPPVSGGASLSELWAFIRYFLAVTPDADLRLTQDFLDMDPHQKTILSDDFGMGFTMHWLANKLNLIAVCDGRYFIQNHLFQVGGSYSGGTGKKGLGKSPDFIGYDANGKFHVIECKGTQSSLDYRNRQLRDSGSVQKRTVSFPTRVAGERLCAGIFIAGPTGDASSMRIIDPEPPEIYTVDENGVEAGRSAIAQGLLAKQIRSAGFPRTSSVVAFPSRRRSVENMALPEESDEEWRQRLDASIAEANALSDHVFDADGESYAGRRAVIQLSRPLLTKRGEYSAVEIRRGIARSTFEQVRRLSTEPSSMAIEESAVSMGRFSSGERQGRSWVMIGNNYYSDIRLLR